MQLAAPAPAPAAPFQPNARLVIGVDPIGFAGDRRIVIEYSEGVPLNVWVPGADHSRPFAELAQRDRELVDRLTAAARAVEDANFPKLYDRPDRSQYWSRELRNGEFLVSMSHWPGAPTSSMGFAANLKRLPAHVPAGLQDLIAALRDIR